MTARKGYTMETSVRIYDDSDGNYIEIKPDSDALGLIDIYRVFDGKKESADLRVNRQEALLMIQGLQKVIDNNEEIISK